MHDPQPSQLRLLRSLNTISFVSFGTSINCIMYKRNPDTGICQPAIAGQFLQTDYWDKNEVTFTGKIILPSVTRKDSIDNQIECVVRKDKTTDEPAKLTISVNELSLVYHLATDMSINDVQSIDLNALIVTHEDGTVTKLHIHNFEQRDRAIIYNIFDCNRLRDMCTPRVVDATEAGLCQYLDIVQVARHDINTRRHKDDAYSVGYIQGLYETVEQFARSAELRVDDHVWTIMFQRAGYQYIFVPAPETRGDVSDRARRRELEIQAERITATSAHNKIVSVLAFKNITVIMITMLAAPSND